MIIIEIVESGLGGIGGILVLILVIALLANCCSGPASTATDDADYVETVETVATIPEVADLTSLHILGTHSDILTNIHKDNTEDSYGKTYRGPYFDLCSYDDTRAYTDLVAGGHFKYLSGTFFARSTQNDSHTIEFFVYADGVLVYNSGPIDRRTKPIEFTVDIGNCDIVRVMSASSDYGYTNPGIELVNAQVHN